MADRSISISLEAKVSGFVAGMRTAQQATKDTGDRLSAFAKQHEQSLDRVGRAGMLMGGGLLAGVAVAVKSFADFDKAMSDVKASTHETAGNMDLLRQAAIDAGADTAFSAKEAAQGIDELAKAGLKTSDILGGGLNGALSLAAAGGLDVGQAAEISASALTQFGLKGDKVAHIADLLAAGAGKAQGSVADMGAALNQAGLVAHMTGLTIEETTGGLAAFAAAGLTGSDSGTSFKSMLQRLTPQSKEAEAEMSKLGISAYDAQGNFKGLGAFAGNLKDSMKDLTPEARNAAMGVIFGSDAVRAANVLYENGAEGIAKWTAAVNETGYAAQTAALKQDNLAGDFEKLTGSLDSVFLKSASGANGALRGLVQGAEDFVDSVGKIPAPVLQAGLGLAGVTGGMLLVGGAFVSVIPKVMDGVEAFGKLSDKAPKTAAALKGAGIIGALFAIAGAFGTVQSAITDSEIERSVGKTTSALIALSKQSGAIQQCSILLDDLFQKKDGSALISGVTDLDSAMTRMFKKDWQQSFSDWGEGIIHGIAPGIKGASQVLDESFKTIDDQLASFVQSGNADIAAKAFKQLEDQAALKNIKPEEFKAKFGAYSEALKQADADAKVAAESMGSITTATGQVVPITPEVAKALEDVGLSAQGAVVDIGKFTDALLNAGLMNLSARDAARNYQAAIDAVGASIAANGTTLDINTEKGRANQAALDAIASSGLAVVKANAANGDSQSSLQGNLTDTYNKLIAGAGQFDITGKAAEDLARSIMGVPPGVNIKSWMSDAAKRMAQDTGAAADAVNGKVVNVYVNTHATRFEQIVGLPGTMADGSKGQGAGVYAPGKNPLTKAAGGAISGPGTGTSDEIPALLSNGEHVLTAAEVQRMGGQAAVYRFRALLDGGKLPKFAVGGAVQKANEQAAARRAAASDYQRDARRGNGYRTVADSVSSANSFADRLTSLADSGNVSAAAIRNLYAAAGRGEAGLRSLHARADRLSTSLTNAKSRLDDLNQTRDGVRNSLSGEFSISDAMKNTSPFSDITAKGIQAGATSVLTRIRNFAGKLNKLRAMGYSGAVLQEVAGMGSVEGMVAADALLKANKTDVKNLNGTYTAIDSASKAAGTYVTDAMYKGGVNAAAGLVKGLQSQEKSIQDQMMKIGLGMEKALKAALGIHSPSRKAKAIGDNFSGTLADRLAAGVEPVAKQAAALGDAINVKPQGYIPASQYRPASIASTAGGVTVYVTNPFTGEQVRGIVASVSTGVAKGVVSQADSQSQYTRTGRR